MARKFNKEAEIILPDGEKMVVSTYSGEDGEMCVKLRLPSDYWSLTGMWRAAEGTQYVNGKTVITLDKAPGA